MKDYFIAGKQINLNNISDIKDKLSQIKGEDKESTLYILGKVPIRFLNQIRKLYGNNTIRIITSNSKNFSELTINNYQAYLLPSMFIKTSAYGLEPQVLLTETNATYDHYPVLTLQKEKQPQHFCIANYKVPVSLEDILNEKYGDHANPYEGYIKHIQEVLL